MDINAIREAGAVRARQSGLSYAGALTPQEARAFVQAEPRARIVDVRTRAEWLYVGRVPDALEIEWQLYPEMSANPQFLENLESAADKDSPLLFICRSGVRSHHAAAAAAAAGWRETYNVLEGFEGDLDEAQHRNAKNGWRRAGLPWYQG